MWFPAERANPFLGFFYLDPVRVQVGALPCLLFLLGSEWRLEPASTAVSTHTDGFDSLQ